MGGIPVKIKAGKVMKLPPPATELMMPARTAAKNRKAGGLIGGKCTRKDTWGKELSEVNGTQTVTTFVVNCRRPPTGEQASFLPEDWDWYSVHPPVTISAAPGPGGSSLKPG